LSVLEKDLDPDVTIGLSLPLNYDINSGFFPGTQTTLTQTSSNIRNLLLTNPGERVGHPEFGCGLLKVLFEPMSNSLLDNIEETITTAISFWMPHVSIEKIDVSEDESNPNQMNIDIRFALTFQPNSYETVSVNCLLGI
jgi:phage baseplate assembly protein W